MKITKQNCRNLEVGTIICKEPCRQIVGKYDTLHDGYECEEMEVNEDGDLQVIGNTSMLNAPEIVGLETL